MATDSICGMTVDEATSLRTERDGLTFYFCSARCQQKFLSAPASAKHREKPHGGSQRSPAQRPQRLKRFTPVRCTPKCSRTIPAIAPSAA